MAAASSSRPGDGPARRARSRRRLSRRVRPCRVPLTRHDSMITCYHKQASRRFDSRRSTSSRDASCGFRRAGARRSRWKAATPSSSRAGSRGRCAAAPPRRPRRRLQRRRRRSSLVERVASAGGLPLQVGGGYRSLDAIAAAHRSGRRSGHGRHGRPLPAFLARGGGALRRGSRRRDRRARRRGRGRGLDARLGHHCRGARRRRARGRVCRGCS